ncbi:conserved hypothetical protein, membrane, partial [mine drainage metagenome]
YATIIVMMLIAYKFGMFIPRVRKEKSSRKHKRLHAKPAYLGYGYAVPILLALAFGIVAFIFSMPYPGSINASAYNFNRSASVNYAALGQGALSILANSHQNITELSMIGADYAFSIGNQANASSLTDVLVNYTRYPAAGSPNIAYSKVLRSSALISNNGVTLHTGTVISENHTFVVNYFSLPYETNGTEVTLRYELFKLVNSTTQQQCGAISNYNISTINSLQSGIYNLFHMRSTSYSDMFCSSYNILDSLRG